MFKNFKLLDCTLRDGGYINNWEFDEDFASNLYNCINSSRCEYIEVGFFEPQSQTPKPYTSFKPENIRPFLGGVTKTALLVNYNRELNLEMFPMQADFGISMLRIAAHKQDRHEASEFSAQLSAKGYETTVNYMGISNYSDAEIVELADLMNLYKGKVSYFYIADSFGSLVPAKTRWIFETLRNISDAGLGFHPHNNLQLAFANTFEALKNGADIVDGSIYGMGRGGGNLNLEALLVFLEQAVPGKYDVLPVLDFAEIYMEQLQKRYSWGYSLPNVISGALACHPNYPKEMLKFKSFSAKEVFDFLSVIPKTEKGKFNKEYCIDSFFNYRKEKSDNLKPIVSASFKNLVFEKQKKALVVCGGNSVATQREQINDFISSNNPAIVSVNSTVLPFEINAVFFGNSRRFSRYYNEARDKYEVILNPFIEPSNNIDLNIEFLSRVPIKAFLPSLSFAKNYPQKIPTNSGVEAILALSYLGFKEIFVVGMDGYSINQDKYYYPQDDIPTLLETCLQLDECANSELEAAKLLIEGESAAFKSKFIF